MNVALVGQPNVGKSSLFTRLTGVGVISSNYSGTTVEFKESVVIRNGVPVRVCDLPGTYGLSGEFLRQGVEDDGSEFDAIIVIADAMNLESGLVLCFEVMELGLPAILTINKFDLSRKKYDLDLELLSETLGLSVVVVSARTAEGVDDLLDACISPIEISDYRLEYHHCLEEDIEKLGSALEDTRFDKRGTAIKLLEGAQDFIDSVPGETAAEAERMRVDYEKSHGESPGASTGRSRYAAADTIIKRVQTRVHRQQTRAERTSDITVNPSTGIPILIGVCVLLFLGITYIGAFLDEIVVSVYGMCIGDAVSSYAESVGGSLGAVLTGINGSIEAILSLVIAYIMVFYLMLGFLEDSGYLTRAVVLLDTVMHKFGLHGGAFIPMMVGLGCNVPAIMATRTIRSRRERLILTTIIVMAVPCSAQMAIIIGITGAYAGLLYAFLILAVLLALICVLGVTLNKFLKYEPSNLALELPDLVMPQMKNILFKTWDRIKDFFYIAFPLLVVGSVIVEVMLAYDMLDFIVGPLSFVTEDMLGLPAVTAIAFIVGILRKEMAVGMLAILFGCSVSELGAYLAPEQFVVFGVVMAVFMPCIATLAVMGRELGWKDTLMVCAASICTAILIGTAFNFALAAI